METQKTITLIVTGIISIAIFLLIIQLLLKNLRTKAEKNGILNTSFAIYFSTLFLSSSLILVKSISLLNEAIDNLFKINPESLWIQIIKTTSIYIGISVLWFFLWYYVASVFLGIVLSKRQDLIEIENDHYQYFLIKGIVIMGFMLSLSPVFEILLRVFIPSIQIPFYH